TPRRAEQTRDARISEPAARRLLRQVAQPLPQPAIARIARQPAAVDPLRLVRVARLPPHVAEHPMSGAAARAALDGVASPRERLGEARLLGEGAREPLGRGGVARDVLERLAERGLGLGVLLLAVVQERDVAEAQRLAPAGGRRQAARAPREPRPFELVGLELLARDRLTDRQLVVLVGFALFRLGARLRQLSFGFLGRLAFDVLRGTRARH